MTIHTKIKEDAQPVTIRVPLTFKRRGGRKVILAPDGTRIANAARPRIDNAMIKAIARAYRWQGLLEDGTYATIEEIAAAERINPSYVGRVLRLTLLAPDIVEAILEGRHPTTQQLDNLLRPFPVVWRDQRALSNRIK